MVHLKQALSDVRAYMRSESGPKRRSLRLRSRCRQIQPMSQRHADLACVATTQLRRQASSSHSLLIHSHPIRMVPGFEFSKDALENSRIYSAIVVFNLALSFHVQALSRRDTGQKSLFTHSKSLYRHAFLLITDTVRMYQGRATGNILLDLLAIGLFNNMALLHLEFSEDKEARFLFQRLVQYTEPISEDHESTTSHPVMHGLVQCFLANASIVGSSSLPIAPAA